MVSSTEILERALQHQLERATTYDSPAGERSMGKAVVAFNALTGKNILESEGWLLLQLLKDARLFGVSKYHADSAEDCVSYASLKAEARARE